MLSIIIMTWNEEKRIGRMLQSIINEQYQEDFEVLVVDGFSTDSTRDIVSSYWDRLPVYVILGLGKGIGADRNYGGYMSSGDLLVFTEGDCYLQEGLLMKIQDSFKDPSLVAWTTIALPNGSPWYVQFIYWFYDVCRYLLSRAPYPVKGYSTSGAMMVMRKSIFLKLRGFQEGGAMNDDGVLGRKIRDYCQNKSYRFMFNLNPKTVIYRSMGRFNKGILEALNHYIYVLVNFFPFLEPLLKTQMKVEGMRFQDEKIHK